MNRKIKFIVTGATVLLMAVPSFAQDQGASVEANPQKEVIPSGPPSELVPTPPIQPATPNQTTSNQAPSSADQIPTAPPSQRPGSNLPDSNSQPPAGFSFYCDRYKVYYPLVTTCPEGWVAIPASTNSPTTAQQPQPVPVPPPQPEPGWYWGNRYSEPASARPNVISLELFGRANDYSLNYDHALSDRWALGVGVSYWNQTYYWSMYNTNVTIVPVYANYYFSDRPDRGYFTFGAEYIQGTQAGNSNNIFLNDTVAGVVGLGYEVRYNGGFLMRLNAYLIGNQNTVIFNPGFSFGFAF